MAQVNVTINSRQYRMACEDGQEEHLMQLARDIDERIENLRGNFGEVGDSRLTVMAALTVADELVEAGKKIRRLEEELAALQDARVASADRAQQTQVAIIAALNAASERIEGITRTLNQTVGNANGIAVGG
jgi:cell division protein ZapA